MSEVVVGPASATQEVVEISATVVPLIPRVNEMSGAGASVTSGSNVVSAPGAAFDNRVVGCIFRLGMDTVQPIGYDSSNWDFQAFVVSVTDAETLVLSESAPATATRGYCLSSPIDAEASTMLEYIEDEAYHQFTKNHDHKSFQVARQVASDSLRLAMARDNKASLNGYTKCGSGIMAGYFYTFSDDVV